MVAKNLFCSQCAVLSVYFYLIEKVITQILITSRCFFAIIYVIYWEWSTQETKPNWLRTITKKKKKQLKAQYVCWFTNYQQIKNLLKKQFRSLNSSMLSTIKFTCQRRVINSLRYSSMYCFVFCVFPLFYPYNYVDRVLFAGFFTPFSFFFISNTFFRHLFIISFH